jgi:uncharacterized protein (DUF1810 family)
MGDRFNLERFVRAQEDEATYEHAVDELRIGHKTSHWMWFVFPQIVGLGQSPTSKRYAITLLEEAKAYLVHPVLGPRLLECSGIATIVGKSAAQIFGDLDAQKLRSSMTLFLRADPIASAAPSSMYVLRSLLHLDRPAVRRACKCHDDRPLRPSGRGRQEEGSEELARAVRNRRVITRTPLPSTDGHVVLAMYGPLPTIRRTRVVIDGAGGTGVSLGTRGLLSV